MSVSKPETIPGPHGSKQRIWSVENISRWILKMLLAMAFFFVFMFIGEYRWNIQGDYLFYFMFIFLDYVISGILAFFLSYMIIKFMFGQYLHRQVKPLKTMVKGKRRMKTLWIYIFTILFQTFFFIFSVNMILAGNIPLVDSLAYFLAWMILWVISRVLGRLLFFILYTW
jgi:hypothetical protein